MKTITSLLILASLLFAGINKEKIDYNKYDNIPVDKIAKGLAFSISKNAPFQIDSVTKLLRAFALDNKIAIYKEVDLEASIELAEMWQNTPEDLKYMAFEQDGQIACNTESLFYFITKKDLIIHQNYVDQNNKPLFDFTINKEDCLKIVKMN